MKILLIFFGLMMASCHDISGNSDDAWRQNIIEQSENKVKQIEQQLQADCDSSILAYARLKADSIRLVNQRKIVKVKAVR